MKHISEELELILDKEFKVLDSGFIRVVDYMGNDKSIADAARTCYGKGTKTINDDVNLIRYLMKHNHTSPFEFCEITFHIRLPIDVARQWWRHRTFSINEVSTRYSEALDMKHTINSNEWRLQSLDNKQGSGGFLDPEKGNELSIKQINLHKIIDSTYKERLNVGVAREQARTDLTLSNYTEAYIKIDLHNLFHFLELRMDNHAQLEIREYANIIGNEIVSKWVPIAWKSFLDYRVNAIKFSSEELKVLGDILDDRFMDYMSELDRYNIEGTFNKMINDSIQSCKSSLSNREISELIHKLKTISGR